MGELLTGVVFLALGRVGQDGVRGADLLELLLGIIPLLRNHLVRVVPQRRALVCLHARVQTIYFQP